VFEREILDILRFKEALTFGITCTMYHFVDSVTLVQRGEQNMLHSVVMAIQQAKAKASGATVVGYG